MIDVADQAALGEHGNNKHLDRILDRGRDHACSGQLVYRDVARPSRPMVHPT
jgi:hypothetical protein